MGAGRQEVGRATATGGGHGAHQQPTEGRAHDGRELEEAAVPGHRVLEGGVGTSDGSSAGASRPGKRPHQPQHRDTPYSSGTRAEVITTRARACAGWRSQHVLSGCRNWKRASLGLIVRQDRQRQGADHADEVGHQRHAAAAQAVARCPAGIISPMIGYHLGQPDQAQGHGRVRQAINLPGHGHAHHLQAEVGCTAIRGRTAGSCGRPGRRKARGSLGWQTSGSVRDQSARQAASIKATAGRWASCWRSREIGHSLEGRRRGGFLFRGVVAAAHQRPGLDVRQAQREAGLAQGLETPRAASSAPAAGWFGLGRRYCPIVRMLTRRTPDGHQRPAFIELPRLAHHEPLLTECRGDRHGCGGTAQVALIRGLRMDPAIEPRHRLDVVVEDAGLGVQDPSQGPPGRRGNRDQNLHAAGRQKPCDGLQGAGEDPRPAVGQFVAVDRRSARRTAGRGRPPPAPRAAARPRRPCGPAGGDVAEAAGAGADVAQNHEGRGGGGSSTRRCWGSGPTRRPCANADRPPAISGRV